MRLVKRVPEAAMVAAFLRAEVSSPRFGADVRKAMRAHEVGTAVISHPDLGNEQDNELRALVLGECRGYRQNRAMFEGIPDGLIWYDAELARSEIGDLRYVDYSYWNELTGHSHLVRDGVRSIRKGKIVYDVPNDRFWALAEEVRRGGRDFEPMILWGRDPDAPLEILEGHLRATAFGLAGDEAPAVIEALVGLVNAP